MKCKSIDNCTSTSCNNPPSAKSPRKNRTEISDTPAKNAPKETIKEPKNEKKQKKVRDKEEKPETITTKPSDTNADVTDRIFIMGDSTSEVMNYHKEWKTVKFLLKAFLVQK